MRSFLSLAALAALAPATLAKVYIYKPVEASHYQPGDSFTVSWRDDCTSPSWTSWGASSIGLYTGSATSQTLLATLGHVDDAAATPAMKITIDGSWGPDSDQYFIRVQSEAGTDATTSDPLQAFSARFTLSGMTGTFSSAVQAQLAGSAVPAAAAAGTTTAAAAAGASSSAMAKIASASSPAVKVASTAASASVAASKASGASASSAAPSSASASGNSTTSAAGMERGVAGGAVALAAVALAALA